MKELRVKSAVILFQYHKHVQKRNGYQFCNLSKSSYHQRFHKTAAIEKTSQNIILSRDNIKIRINRKHTTLSVESSMFLEKKAMAVSTGIPHKEHPYQKEIEDKQAFRLREKLVAKKHRNLYKSMRAGEEKRKKEIWLLRKKRRLHEEKLKEEKKAAKHEQKMQALEAASSKLELV